MARLRFRFVWLLSVTLVALLCVNLSLADETDRLLPPDWDPIMGPPIEKTPWEIANEKYAPTVISQTNEIPPAPVVNPAEWEPMTGVLIRYPLGLPISLVAEMSENAEIKTIVSGTSQMNQAISQYQSGGVNMANCTWLIAPSNSMWTRDYGPWYIFQGEDVQGITDHIYNRPWRPDDNNIPWVLGDSLNIPVYGMQVIHTGGNYMSDGMGVGMSTTLVYNENPSLTQAQVNDSMFLYLGLEDYVTMVDILSGGIHHIDCWAKLLDPGRLIVKKLTPANAQLEANVAYLQSLVSSYGRPYEVIRVDCASSTPYTNSLILNNKVFVPLFNNSLDAQAMQTYQEAMPGYEILGYTGSWVSDDAIHCRAMGMTDRYMLRIVHIPLLTRENNGQDYLVQARIHAYSDMPFTGGTPEVFWKTDGGPYLSIPMTPTSGDTFTAYIPEQADYTNIDYYIHAEDDSNRSENHPYIGAGDPHHFIVLPETSAEVALTPENPPIIIPPGGGSFGYNINISNACTIPLKVDGWIEADLPTGNTFEVMKKFNLNLSAGASLTRAMTQNVPGNAPAGDYTYRAKVGLYPNLVYDFDSFTFEKAAGGGSGFGDGEWALSGWQEAGVAASEVPVGYYLSQNYPNPFNPLTTIVYSLPQAAQVRLTVYDVSGRQVASVVDGWRDGGVHEVTWNAADQTAGVYFYRITAGDFTAVGKMMLVK